MPRHDTLYPGQGIDIAVQIDGQLVVATVEGSRVRLARSGGVEYLTPPRAIHPPTLRIAVNQAGEIAVIGQVIDPDRAALYLRGEWRVLPYSLWGQNPMGIAAAGDQFVWAVVTDGGGTLRTEIEFGGSVATAIPNGGTSQGILQWDGSRFVLADERKNVAGLFRGTTVDGWVVGYGDNTAVIVKDGYRYTLAQGNPSTPRLAVNDGIVYVAYQHLGAAQVIRLTPPYPVDAPAVIPAIGRPMFCGFFEFVPATNLPANCSLRQVSSWEWWLTVGSRTIATYVSGEPDGSLAALERSIDAVKGRGIPTIAYWPRALQAGRLPRGADWVGVEAYRLKDETLSAFEARVTTAVRRCGKAVIVAQVYTSNGLNTSDLASLVPVYARIAKTCQNVVGILAFSGSGRATGYQDHPEIHDEWGQLFKGITGAPVTAPVLLRPSLKVGDFSKLSLAGPLIEFEDRGTTYELFTKENGSLHIRAENAAGVDQTSQRRQVI